MSATASDPHPCFRAALSAALAHVEHEGSLAGVGNARLYSASENGITLSTAVSTGNGPATVAVARHSGATDSWTRAVCERFCGLIEGLPLQEVAEHGAIQLIERLRDPDQPRPVGGILTTRNAGPVFGMLERLARAIYAEHVGATDLKPGPNHWNPRLPAEWARKRKEEQIEVLKPILAAQLCDEGLDADAGQITGVERGLRVTMAFGPGVAAQRKPALLMRIERRIRRETGGRLEVFAEEMHDQNVIRRL